MLGAAALGAAGCGIAPWSMGAPLNGKPSIPPTTESPSVSQLRAQARVERTAGRVALELRLLRAIDDAQRLTTNERARLVALLEQSANELLAMRRPVPACDDLRRLERLAPARARTLASVHAQAERETGDVWLAVGDGKRARAAYEIAAALGAEATDIRLVAAGGQAPPPHLEKVMAERAILELPLRAVPPFAAVYIARREDPLNRAVLERARLAAVQEKRPMLAARIDQALAAMAAAPSSTAPPPSASLLVPAEESAPPLPVDPSSPSWDRTPEALLDAPAAPAAAAAPADPAALQEWVVGAAAVSFRLLPLLQRTEALLAPGPRSRAWARLLLDEDPTSPDVLEIGALVDGLAGRVGGAERKLTDLVYFSPDRYQGMVRAAQIWRRVGQPRLACVAWLRAARWRDEVDDPAWRQAIDCTHADPGAGDWRAIRQYVLDRAPPERREGLRPILDPAADPAAGRTAGPLAAPVSVRPAGGPIPCDTGGSPR